MGCDKYTYKTPEGTKTFETRQLLADYMLEEGKTSSVPYYEGNIKPEPNTVFVFGSNPEGRHGAGAAKIAKNQFGAEYGNGEGFQGNAYALPTKDLRIKDNKSLRSISPENITKSIQKLYKTALENPNKQFKVAFRNKANEKTLNGYNGSEMIDMFNNAGNIPSNVVFSKEWFDTGLLGKTSSNVVSDIKDLDYDPSNPFADRDNIPITKRAQTMKEFEDQIVNRLVTDNVKSPFSKKNKEGDYLVKKGKSYRAEAIRAAEIVM